MAKKQRNKKTKKVTQPIFPSAADPRKALEWWRDKILYGIPPFGAAENLRDLAGHADNAELRKLFLALERAAGDVIHDVPGLQSAQRVTDNLVSRPDLNRVYSSSATGGINCHSYPDGRLIWAIPAERAFQVGGLATGDKALYYTDSWNGRLCAVNISNGAQIWSAAAAPDGAPLLSPAGLAIQHNADSSRLVVCDSASHRLCTFGLGGEPLDIHGTRGLLDEEITHLNTAPNGTARPPYFEYPRALNITTDCDGEPGVFVWDSGNGRVVILDSDLLPKRNILLMPEREVKPRLAGQVQIRSGPSGPVILVVDDSTQTLAVRSSEGELLFAVDLAPLMAASRRTLESIRLDSGGDSGEDLLIVAGNGRMFRLSRSLLDIRSLAATLLTVSPGDYRLVMAGMAGDSGEGAKPESWRQISPALDPSALVRCLLREDGVLTGEFASAARRISELASRLELLALAAESTTLRQTLEAQLEELRVNCLATLEQLAAPSPGDLSGWSEALCEVDMELFQSRGRLSSAELALDHQLEQVRELRPSIRRCGWRLRTVQSLLSSVSNIQRSNIFAEEMLVILSRLLDRRIEILSAAAGRMEYDRDPQRVQREELQAAHSLKLQVSAIEAAAAELSGELARISGETPIFSGNDLSTMLTVCLEKSAGLACNKTLAGIAGKKTGSISSLPVPELNGATGQTLSMLVDNMGAYLKQIEGNGELDGPFGKVLERQKNLFAVKVSVLANYCTANGRDRELLKRASRLSGDAWADNRNLRPAALTVED